NQHFSDINDRARTTQHYWAENSRQLISLMTQLDQDLHDLGRAGSEVELDQRYRDALDRCRPWLAPSGGSAIPDDFDPIIILNYEPAFSLSSATVQLKKS